MAEEDSTRNITFRYEKHPDYRIIFANGALGGTTPRGDIKFDLFIEYLEVPEETVHMITPDGMGPEIERRPSTSPLTRQSQIGVIMNPGQAKSLAYWLMSQVDMIEKKRKPTT
jgi:hypothetical protein